MSKSKIYTPGKRILNTHFQEFSLEPLKTPFCPV